ncbi:MAG: Fic family protein [Gammaproteobacteria bacterium]|nr:Fic family protein [Gammaproteobacteria bacterium]
MATPNEKLAVALQVLADRQGEGRHIFLAREFHRDHRERLLRGGYLRRVIKGWLILSSPEALPHDTTAWYASFWEFCARYCAHRFGDRWHISPELSLRLHAEDTSVPRQVVVYAERGGNNNVDLPFGMSLFDLKSPHLPLADIFEREGLRTYTTEAALLRVPPRFFRDCPIEARTALAGVVQVTGIVQRLLAGNHSTVAGRLAGAFRHVGRGGFADEIGRAMRQAGYDAFREVDPFVPENTTRESQMAHVLRHSAPPIAHRLQALWARMREPILAALPPPQGLPASATRQRYLERVSAAYLDDAYHSLSIEGYQVSPELIERVRAGAWDPGTDAMDRRQRDALAARGYWQAFQSVQESLEEVLGGADPGAVFRVTHGRWHSELFRPSLEAGLHETFALAGYRNQPVLLRGSRHVPPRAEIVPDCMETLLDLLEQEEAPAVRAVAGHWMLGYIHPFADGNGRIGRFLMNIMLASGGYPWTTIRVDDRNEYMAALEAASVEQDIAPFAAFVARCVSLAGSE